MAGALDIAILAHSTNPRGGVVHALALGDALIDLGHDAVVHAPDATGRGFFRTTTCGTALVPAAALGSNPRSSAPSNSAAPTCVRGAASLKAADDTHAMVETRVGDYLRYFAEPEHRGFGVFHAQDSISGNALATLKRQGLIEAFARTVHHLDAFEDPRLEALQRRAIVQADAHFVVSPMWKDRIRTEFGLDAIVVGNGVDLRRYTPRADPADLILRRRLGLEGGPVFLAIGGVEERKNTLRILEAFAQIHSIRPGAQLVIAGGRSLLDHSAYQARFDERVAVLDLPDHALRRIGPVEDIDMAGLYRNADALVFPSLKEGFGLVVLEAMASGLPVITARAPPFTGYLSEEDAIWCNPENVPSIANAMMLALLPAVRALLASRGPAVAAQHDWHNTARAHLVAYQTLGALQHA